MFVFYDWIVREKCKQSLRVPALLFGAAELACEIMVLINLIIAGVLLYG